MILALALILSLYLSVNYQRCSIVLLYYAFSLFMLFLLAYEGVEAAYQISPKPSDTYLYYNTFHMDFMEMSGQVFHEYPLILRLIVFPFDNAFLAIFSQSVFIALAVMLALKRNSYTAYAIILLSHCVIYMSTNFFKDNLILILVFFSIYLLGAFRSLFLRVIIIALAIYLSSYLRPFMLLFMPLAFSPIFIHSKSKSLKVFFVVILLSAFVVVIYKNWGLINYVATSWSSEHSVGTTGASLLAPIKILLGPTPLNYIEYEYHFVQPILKSHAYMLSLLNVFFYFLLSLVLVMVFVNYKRLTGIYTSNVSSVFLLGIGLGLMIVYIVAYGTADIRQRALIHSFIFASFFVSHDFRMEVLNRVEVILALALTGFVFLVTVVMR